MSAFQTLFPISERAAATIARKGLREVIKSLNKASDKSQLRQGISEGNYYRFPKYRQTVLDPLQEAATARKGNPTAMVSEAVNTGMVNGRKLSANQRRQLAIQNQALQDMMAGKKPDWRAYIGYRPNDSLDFQRLSDAVGDNASTIVKPLSKLMQENDWGRVMKLAPYTWVNKNVDELTNIINKKVQLNTPSLFDEVNADKETVAKGLARARILNNLYNNNIIKLRNDNPNTLINLLQNKNYKNWSEISKVKKKEYGLTDINPHPTFFDEMAQDLGNTPEIRKTLKEFAPLHNIIPSNIEDFSYRGFIKEASKLNPSQLETLKSIMDGWSGTMAELFATARIL